MNLKLPKTLTLMVILSVSIIFSCSEDNVDQAKLATQISEASTSEVLLNAKIRAEILAMANGNKNSRISNLPSIQLPTGYDYNNLKTVKINGISGTTYVAFSLTLINIIFRAVVQIL